MKIPYQSNQRQVMPTGGSAENIALTASGGQNTFLDTLTKISGDAFQQKYDLEQKKQAIDLISDLSTFDAETETTLQSIQEPGEYVAMRQQAKAAKLKTVGQTYDKKFLDEYYGNFADWEDKYDNTTRKTALKLKNTKIALDLDTTSRKMLETVPSDLEDAIQRLAVLEAKKNDGVSEGALDEKKTRDYLDKIEQSMFSSLLNKTVNESQEEVVQVPFASRDQYIENRVKTYGEIYDEAQKRIGVGKLGGKSV